MTPRQESGQSRQRPLRPKELIRGGGGLRRRLRSVVSEQIGYKTLMLVGGPVYFAIVNTAFRLNLIGLICERPGLTLEEIRQELRLEEEPAHILLLGCVALKLLRKRGGKYYSASLFTAKLLNPQSRRNLGPVLDWMQEIVAPTMRYFEETIRTGRIAGLQALPGEGDNLYDRLASEPRLQSIFYGAMNARTQTTNPEFIERIDFSRFQRVLDVAGGDGEILCEIAKRYPKIQGTLLEIPAVVPHALARFERLGLAERLTVQPADIFGEPFPTGHDCVLFCHVNGNHTPESNRQLMRQAYESLASGGIVCIYSAFMHDDGTGPLSSALLSAYFYGTVSGKGRQYSWEESSSWISAAGFTDITRATLLENHGVILGRKP